MSGRAAAQPEARVPRVVVVTGGAPREVFEVVSLADDVLQVRAAFLFEIGEELAVRIERAGRVDDAIARVRGHVGPADARLTELELSPRGEASGATGDASAAARARGA